MNNDPGPVRPYAFYTVMRQSQDPKTLRLRMALYAKDKGVKAAARAFHTTPKTVRKWMRGFDGRLASLESHSRAPHQRPRKLDKRAQEKILTAKRSCPRFSARRLKDQFELSYSVKAIARVCREHGLSRTWRRKNPRPNACCARSRSSGGSSSRSTSTPRISAISRSIGSPSRA